MAEYYPLLAKAVGSLPNSTLDTRRIVYERARKALIGQLRTLHPPVPDDDIERESVSLDRAIERLEAEIAAGSSPGAVAPTKPVSPPPAPAAKPAAPAPKPIARPAPTLPGAGGAIGPAAKRPLPPLRTKPATPPLAKPPAPTVPVPAVTPPPPLEPSAVAVPEAESPLVEPPLTAPVEAQPSETRPEPPPPDAERPPPVDADKPTISSKRLKPPRGESQRPIAPQPPQADGQKRRLWIVPLGIGVVVACVAGAAWKLRDRPENIARKPAAQTQADSGKIADRVGGADTSKPDATAPQQQPAPEGPPPAASNAPEQAPATTAQPHQEAPAPSNPALPVAHRAALLVEAPDEPNKVKTFLGTVVWKLNNEPQGQTDAVGLAVEADIDLPDDKMKAVVTFEKNSDSSLPASHTIKVRFMPEPGSYTGDVKQISVPQMRPEASPSGEALAGVTVPVVQDSFLVGLSPGNAETANIDLLRKLQWIDIPILLDNGKIAKLTFEKGDSGQRDINEAVEAWQKQ